MGAFHVIFFHSAQIDTHIADATLHFTQASISITKSQVSDFVETDYATGAEGDLATSALQSGANISTLTNDSGFITSAPVTSVAGKTGVVTLVEADITDLQSYLLNVTGESIKDLSDVFSTMTPTDGQVLTFDTTNGWQAEAAGGGGTWGSITGTLSSQTDLQSALDAKAASSHSHVNTDIDGVVTITNQTTDGIQATAGSITVDANSTRVIKVTAFGREVGPNDVYWKTFTFGVMTTATAVTQIGSESAQVGYDTLAATWTIVPSMNTNRIVDFLVTGQTSKTIKI